MKNRIKFCLLFLISIIILQSCSKTIEGDLIITKVNIIDVKTGDVNINMDVIITGEKITSIIEHKDNSKYKSETVVDGAEKFLIPGLWDMHVHALQGANYENALPMYIANGITGIRDMWGDLRLRDSLEILGTIGGLPVPRMMVAGNILGGNPARNGTSIATIEEGLEYVEILVANGADFIKTYEYLKPEIYEAILEKANELNVPVYGHPPKLVGINRAIELGQKSFEHLSQIPIWCTPNSRFLINDMSNHWYGPEVPMTGEEFDEMILKTYDEAILEALAKKMIDNEVYFCPTIMVYKNLSYPWKTEEINNNHINYLAPFGNWTWQDDISWAKQIFLKDSIGFIPKFKQRQHILSKLIEYGVPIIAGTDAGVTMHGFDLHKELVHYVDAGMTPLQSLQSATLKPAKLFKSKNKSGRVIKGFNADLVLLRENPLEDIRHTQTIEATIVKGKFCAKNKLDSALSLLKERNNKMALDSLRKVLVKGDSKQVIELTKKWQKENDKYYLDGNQLTLLSYEMMRKDRMEDAASLLKEEIRLNAFNSSFASWSLVELMGEVHGIDSAKIYGKRHFEHFGLDHVHINSILKRVSDPFYGQPKYVHIDHEKVEQHEGEYITSESEDRIKLSWYNNSFKMMNNNQWQKLSAVNDSVFHIQGKEPDRIIIKKANNGAQKIYYISGRSTLIYNKIE